MHQPVLGRSASVSPPPAARPCRRRHRAADQLPARHHCRAQATIADRLCGLDHFADRAIGPEFLARDHVDPDLRPSAPLAAVVWLAVAEASDPAGHHASAAAGRRADPAGPQRPARSHARGLHPHRPRQGALSADRAHPPRDAQHAHPGHHRVWASSSATCSAARSSWKPSSVGRASAACWSTRSPSATTRWSRPPFFSSPPSSC